MKQPDTYHIKTVLKVDYRFDTVRQVFSSMLKGRKDVPDDIQKKNSFSFGWVNSFSITPIKVKLVKESDSSTAIFVEAIQPEGNTGQKRVIYAGFYDFLHFLKKKFTAQPVEHTLSWRTEYLGAWVMVCIILLTIFLGWYYLFAN
ncbi:MAG: hypothetical protein KF862_24955 [Chitinophagaceae bacterium]|nr:hypothetical protein [Chitinophagaceae bacterium]